MARPNGKLQVKSELPCNFKTYRHQQHRWTCGPANLFRKMAKDIVKAKVWITLIQCNVICMPGAFSDLYLCVTGGVLMEEVLYGLQFFLRTEDNIPHCHLLSLFCCNSSICYGSRS